VGVGELGRDIDLAQEAIGPERLTQLGPEDLDRDRSLVLEITGKKNDSHATPTELTLESITVGEGRLEEIQQIGHVYSR
jgi:hypothetical protein